MYEFRCGNDKIAPLKNITILFADINTFIIQNVSNFFPCRNLKT